MSREYTTLPSHPYRKLIEEAATLYEPVPANVLEALVWIESEFDSQAQSASSALGLTQIIYAYHATMVNEVADSLDYNGGPQSLLNPRVSLYAGARHLRWLHTDDDPDKRSWSRAIAKYHSGSYEPGDFRDGQGTATNDHVRYFEEALATVTAARGVSDDPSDLEDELNNGESEEPAMSYRTTIPGLPGGPLETSFPIREMIVPAWRTRQRPGIRANLPRLSVQHETGNSNSLAGSEARYLFNGAEGRQASWHLNVDDREAVVSIPLSEVTWQAGDGSGPGNYNGVSCELSVHHEIVGNATRRANSQKNAAELMGKIAARLNATLPARQHANFMNKNCPAQLRNRGEWNRYVGWWTQFREMERRAMQGEEVTRDPVAVGSSVTGTAVVQAEIGLNLRTGPGTGYDVLMVMPDDTEANVRGDDRDGFVPLAVGDSTGWASADWLEVDRTPPPTYATPVPIPALEDALEEVRRLVERDGIDAHKYERAPATVDTEEGMRFVFVADLVEATQDTPRYQYAHSGSAHLGPLIKQGERFVVLWLFTAQDGQSYYYSPWATRILVEHTRRVADSPLLGDDTP